MLESVRLDSEASQFPLAVMQDMQGNSQSKDTHLFKRVAIERSKDKSNLDGKISFTKKLIAVDNNVNSKAMKRKAIVTAKESNVNSKQIKRKAIVTSAQVLKLNDSPTEKSNSIKPRKLEPKNLE